jgi:chemotaxis protein MotB
MAFFMVMWIIGMDPQTKNSIEGYFSNPVGFKKGYSGGKSPVSSGSSPASIQTAPVRLMTRPAEERELGEVSGRIRDSLAKAGLNDLSKNVEIVVTNQGLRIELAEDPSGDLLFPLASFEMKPTLRRALQVIGAELAPLQNPIEVEGHTDAAQYSGLYSNWDLSSARANAARRVLVEPGGVDPSRILEVIGHADRELRIKDNPQDPRNRRISIVLPFVTRADSGESASPLTPPSGPNG